VYLKVQKDTIDLTNINEKKFGRDDLGKFTTKDNAQYITRVSEDRYHFKIIKSEDDYFILDESSSNGTQVNDKDIPSGEKVPLKDGDIINPAGILKIDFVMKS